MIVTIVRQMRHKDADLKAQKLTNTRRTAATHGALMQRRLKKSWTNQFLNSKFIFHGKTADESTSDVEWSMEPNRQWQPINHHFQPVVLRHHPKHLCTVHLICNFFATLHLCLFSVCCGQLPVIVLLLLLVPIIVAGSSVVAASTAAAVGAFQN